MHMPLIEASSSVIEPSSNPALQAPPRSFKRQASQVTRGVILPPPPVRPFDVREAYLKEFHDQIFPSRSRRAARSCARGQGLYDAHADPGTGDPDRARRPRPARHRADRHRQDRGVRAAVDPAPGRGRQARPPDALPHARPRPDARARQPDRRKRARIRQVQPHLGRDRVRRHQHQQESPGHEPRRRYPRRDPGPLARPDRTAFRQPRAGRDSGPRRSRPDARPRLHPRAQEDRADGPSRTPDAVLLGYHAAVDPRLGRPVHHQPRDRRDQARGDDGGARRSVRHLRQPVGKAGAADDDAERSGDRTRAGLHPHQARRRPCRPPARRQRHPGRGDPRQQVRSRSANARWRRSNRARSRC